MYTYYIQCFHFDWFHVNHRLQHPCPSYKSLCSPKGVSSQENGKAWQEFKNSTCTSTQTNTRLRTIRSNHALNLKHPKTIHIVFYRQFSVFANILPMYLAYGSTFLDREFQPTSPKSMKIEPRNHSESPYFQATSITHFGHFLCGELRKGNINPLLWTGIVVRIPTLRNIVKKRMRFKK